VTPMIPAAIRAIAIAHYPTASFTRLAEGLVLAPVTVRSWLAPSGSPSHKTPSGPMVTMLSALSTADPETLGLAAHPRHTPIALILASTICNTPVATGLYLAAPMLPDELTAAIHKLAPNHLSWTHSQVRVAALLGVDPATVRRWLMGDHIENGRGGSRRSVPLAVALMIRAGVLAAEYLDLEGTGITLAQAMINAAAR
jgi:hypothetical protein